MKIELTEERSFNSPSPWYKILVDGIFVIGSFKEEEIKELYEKIKANPDLIKTKENVLKSEEI
jgi:hypothetical protein